jgi:hypothetical protein
MTEDDGGGLGTSIIRMFVMDFVVVLNAVLGIPENLLERLATTVSTQRDVVTCIVPYVFAVLYGMREYSCCREITSE